MHKGENMKKEIYINESLGETRIAILEDGQLVEVYIEKQDKHTVSYTHLTLPTSDLV